MAKKLWQKNLSTNAWVEDFTVGEDNILDVQLAPYDILGNMAHCKMLAKIGLLQKDEADQLLQALKVLYKEVIKDDADFKIQDGVEDIHSQIEFLLTEQLGDIGKKIHAARSRNDQVLVDLKLFLRAEIINIKQDVKALFDKLIALSNQYKDELLPGYTHLQLAMPSSFGLWFGAYAEGLADDLETLLGAYKVINKNPLGSAAGYGSSFPIDRSMTTSLLGFEQMNYNVVYAQMGRGKSERILAQAMANIAETLGRFSMDVCLYMNQNFGFISFPDELTTGSSIMPHKKNPDVFEIIRGFCSQIKALPNEIAMLTANLPSGYHREMQLLKTHLFPCIQHLKNCLQIAVMMLDNIKIQTNLLQNEKYKYLFSVEEVNKLVNAGMPFRDAYKQVGLAIEAGEFTTDYQVHHTHEGSIGNLCNDKIVAYFQTVNAAFQEHKFQTAIAQLIND